MTRLKRFLPILLALSVVSVVFACGPKNGSTVDTTAPIITLAEQPIYYVDETAVIRLASATDDVDGDVAVDFSLFAPSGKEVGASGGVFVPHEAGEYRIIFSARDKAGNSAEKEQSLTVLANSDKPQIKLGDYESDVAEGELYTLPEYSLTEQGKAIAVSVSVKDPHGDSVGIVGDKFFVDRMGAYEIVFSATLSGGSKIQKTIGITSRYGEKTMSGIDGVLTDAMYAGVKSTVLGGLRGLESIFVKTVRTDSGIIMAFDGSEDKRVSAAERIEVFFTSDGRALSPVNGTKRIDLYANGKVEYFEYASGNYKKAAVPDYRDRAAYAVKLGAGTTLDAGNDTDNGYASELFVPYSYIGVKSHESIYMTLGCVREGDGNNWDGWNEFPIFADPLTPYKYVELRRGGYLFNDNRLYRDANKADGKIDDEIYSKTQTAHASTEGLRNLEKANISIARTQSGIHFAFSVASDKYVNDFDRVEVCLNAGERTVNPNTSCLQFWLQSNGGLSVRKGNGRSYVDFDARSVVPAAASTYGKNTTPNDNTDEDDGYFAELYVPYAMFDEYTTAKGVNENTRLGITFGIWRVSENSHATLEWSEDPAKDWDGYSHGDFCDPLRPDTYAVLMTDGRILTQKEIVDIIGKPTDPSVDGVLSESYWDSAATLEIAPDGDADGVMIKLFRADTGLRVAFIGEVRQFTAKDAIAFYVSTKDSSYELGGMEGLPDDGYEVFGQYASCYDYCFQIWFDSSVAAYRGKYKDWADRMTDLSQISLYIAKTSNSFIVEMFVPYAFFTAPDGFAPDRNDTLGVTVRLAGENERGSVVWNNLHYAGIYADSESPASYVRIDKDNKLFASTANAAETRIDGAFTDAVYNGSYAEIVGGASSIKLYRGEKGLYGRLKFGDGDSASVVISTIDHGLGKPYIYDYRITVYRDGRIQSSYGNSHGFYDPSLYVSYCTPRVSIADGEAELFIPYDYLSRYNTTDNYTEKGYMRITVDSVLRLAASFGDRSGGECVYNGNNVEFDLFDPSSYVGFATKEN